MELEKNSEIELINNESKHLKKEQDCGSSKANIFDPSNFDVTVAEKISQNDINNVDLSVNDKNTDNGTTGESETQDITVSIENIPETNQNDIKIHTNGALKNMDNVTSNNKEKILDEGELPQLPLNFETEESHVCVKIDANIKTSELSNEIDFGNSSKNVDEVENTDDGDSHDNNDDDGEDDFGDFENGTDNFTSFSSSKDVHVVLSSENNSTTNVENDDFGAFDSHDQVTSTDTCFDAQTSESNKSDSTIDNNEDDDFADFGSFDDSAIPSQIFSDEINHSASKLDEEDDFGTFSDDDDLKFSDDETDNFGSLDNKIATFKFKFTEISNMPKKQSSISEKVKYCI